VAIYAIHSFQVLILSLNSLIYEVKSVAELTKLSRAAKAASLLAKAALTTRFK